MSGPNELVYFTVEGSFYDAEASSTIGTTDALQLLPISAFITFTARLAPGTIIYVADLDLGDNGSANTGLALAPITGRILGGQIQTINQADTPNMQLVANDPMLGLDQLIYDVTFSNVTYAGKPHAIKSFAFAAPSTAVTLDLTDPTLTRLPYEPTNYTA